MSQFEIVLAVMVVVLSLKSLADKIRTAQKESDYEDAKKKLISVLDDRLTCANNHIAAYISDDSLSYSKAYDELVSQVSNPEVFLGANARFFNTVHPSFSKR